MVRSTAGPWSAERPRVLVVACSDGRLQEQIDEFLEAELALTRYDRLYVPGGPGGLASSGFEVFRAAQYQRDVAFLLEAHQVHTVILIFHTGSLQGPDEAICADYARKLPGRSGRELRSQMDADAAEVLSKGFAWPRDVRVRAYRAEVMPDGIVRFLHLGDR